MTRAILRGSAGYLGVYDSRQVGNHYNFIRLDLNFIILPKNE